MSTCSPAKLLANRRNAQKSTGPRTAEGKAISRENSFKHGMTGEGVVVTGEDAAEIDSRFAVLESEFQPGSKFAGLLVRRVAMITVRLERCVRQEAANIFAAGRDGSRPRSSEPAGSRPRIEYRIIDRAPAASLRKLMETRDGVDVLVAAWEQLKADLDHEEGTRWTKLRAYKSEFMHGSIRRDHRRLVLSRPGPTPTKAGTTGSGPSSSHHVEPGRIAGGSRWRSSASWATPTSSGSARSGRRWSHVGDDPEITYAAEIALFDPSPEDGLARKYEAAAERALFRTVKELREIRAEASAEKVETPEATPEPESEPAPGGAAVGSSFPAPLGWA